MIPRLFVCIFLVGAGKGDREGERGVYFYFISTRFYFFSSWSKTNVIAINLRFITTSILITVRITLDSQRLSTDIVSDAISTICSFNRITRLI